MSGLPDGIPSGWPVEIAVLIPFYADQAGLDRLLAALTLQTLSPERFEVVIADDGSPRAPRVGDRPFRVHVVRQDDRGFRAAEARNLGVTATRAPVLAFLDGDMIPEPGYLAALLAAVDERTLCVARRRHADLTGWSVRAVTGWLAGAGPAPEVLPEPAWLADGYRATHDLARADDTSYRFVISAVLGAPRARLLRLGGFAADFTGYGGEDWDLAYRWRLAGGTLRHVPEAVAWHDGPDFGGRGDAQARREVKDAETLRLAGRLTVPGARDPRLIWQRPDIAVDLDATGMTAAQVVAVTAPLVTGSDVAVWVRALPQVLAEGLQDPRIRPVPPEAHTDAPDLVPGSGAGQAIGAQRTSRYVVAVRRPGVLQGTTLAALIARAVRGETQPDRDGPLTITHVPTGRCWTPSVAGHWATPPSPQATVESLWDAWRPEADAPGLDAPRRP